MNDEKAGALNITVTALHKGDVNSDNKVDIVDALLIARYDAGLPVSNFNVKAGDVDGNGPVNIVDALHIARYVVGLDVPYLP